MEPQADKARHSNPVAVVYPTMSDSPRERSGSNLDNPRERSGSNLDNLSTEDIHEVKLTVSSDNV